MTAVIFLKKLFRDLKGRKGSLLALMAIVMSGVGIFVGMAGVYRDLDGSRQQYYTNYRLADFTADLKRTPEWVVQDIETLANVQEARGRVRQAVLIEFPDQIKPISGSAISMPLHRTPVLNDILLRSGTWFSGADKREVIVNDAFAKAHGLKLGSRIKVLLLDKQHDLLVIGTAMSPEFVYLIPPGGGLAPDPESYGVLYLPERFLQESCDLDGAYNQIIGSVHDSRPSVIDYTLDVIEDKLDIYGVTQVTPAREQPSVRFLADELEGLKVSVTIIPAFFLTVAALVLNVLMARLVAQQRTVIGTLKALGYSSFAVLMHYVSYGIFIGFLGGIAGLLFGYWLQTVFVKVYRLFFALPEINAHFYPDILMMGFCISIGFAVLGTIKGVRYAVALEPAEAMKPPPPEKGGRVLPERISCFWKMLSFRQKMVFRAVFRNPFRSSVVVFASMISTALLVMTLCNVDALDSLMTHEFKKVSHQDMTITLRDPVGREVNREFNLLPHVSEMEPQLSVACDLSNGSYQKRTGVTGLVRNPHLYTPLDQEGNHIHIPEVGLVLTQKLAEILHADVGDVITLKALIARREKVEAPVAGIVQSFLGLSAYADIRYLSGLIGEEWSANTLQMTSFKRKDQREFYREISESPMAVGINERLQTFRKMNEIFDQTLGTMIGSMVLFAGLIAFGSILNSALVSLSEREREVGTLRVLGYTAGQVSRIFAGESLLINSVGILLGIFLGIGFVHLLSIAYSTELYRFPVVVRPSRLFISVIIMGMIINIAQYIVYHMIRKLNWLDALKVRE